MTTNVAPSTLASRLSALGPGLLMASAAIGASHLVASTQAGALFGWQLFGLILVANLLKYPFFRFGPQYTVESGVSLVEGYARKGKVYLLLFFVLCAYAAVVSTAGVAMLCTVILAYLLPASWGLSVPVLAAILLGVIWVILIGGHYKALDGITKLILVVLSLSTVLAVIVAAIRGPVAQPGFEGPSPWTFASLAFIIALLGWMPAPIEISALNSMWVKAKGEDRQLDKRAVLFDFNLGYIVSTVLALVFLTLGVLVQYGSGTELQIAGGAYIPQLMDMYASAIGTWAKPLVALIAFAAMFGTVITVVDGYGRASGEALRLLRGQPELTRRAKVAWITGISIVALAIITWMGSELADMLRYAMISAFVTAPVFAWLNFSLVRGEKGLSPVLRVLSYAGLVFLGGFTILFLLNQFGVIG